MIATKLFENGRYLTLLVLSVIAVGLTSFNGMARQEDPSITPFVAAVTTYFPGASPARMETLISKPLEDAIREQAEVSEVTSTSTNGVSNILIEVDYTLTRPQIKRVWSELRNKIDKITPFLPEGATQPDFDDDLFTEFVKIVAISASGENDLSPSVLRREAVKFADAAKKVPQTRRIKLFGVPDEEIRVEADSDTLNALGLSVTDVAATIARADSRQPAGRLSDPDASLTIDIEGEFTSLQAVRDTVLLNRQRETSSLTIADIATVSRAESDPPDRVALSNGKRSVLLGVEMKRGNQVDQYSAAFDEFLAGYRDIAPHGLQIDVAYDQSTYTEARLLGVATNILAGIAIVISVLFITLGWRAALVVAVSLPMCTLLSMLVLNYLDVALHQLSLTGLVVAIGLLVDGSIVMTDEIRKHLLEGDDAITAMEKAIGRMTVPLVSATATTVLAFTPMAILQGPSGDFLGSLATCVIVMLISSLLLALTLTPALAGRILPSAIEEGPRWYRTGITMPRLSNAFARSIDWSLANPLASILLAGSIPLLGFISSSTLTQQFFPGTDRDQLYLRVEMPQSVGIESTLAVSRAIDQKLRAESLIRRVDWTVGESPPAFYYNLRSNRQNIPGWAEAMVLTTDENKTDALIRRLQRELDRDFPQAQILVLGIDQGPPVYAPVEVVIYGPDTDTLKQLGDAFRQRLQSLPDITHTKVSISPAAPKIEFIPDTAKLRLVGLQETDIALFINQSLRGVYGGAVLEDTEQIPVRTKLARSETETTTDLRNLLIPIRGVSGQNTTTIPLSALGEFSITPDDSPIGRKNGERINQVQAFLTRGVLPQEALELLQASLKEDPIELPEGYRYTFGGDTEDRGDVINDLIGPLGLVNALLLATIMLTFNSWRLTALSYSVVFGAFGLSFLALAIFRYPLGILALIGVIGSIGVSINAAIIIITSFQQSKAASAGDKVAMRDQVLGSSRHIVSTTLTTFGGFLPLILEGSQFWPPFAMAIAGGVLLSTIVSFYFVPAAYVLLGSPADNRIERAEQKAQQRKARKEAALA